MNYSTPRGPRGQVGSASKDGWVVSRYGVLIGKYTSPQKKPSLRLVVNGAAPTSRDNADLREWHARAEYYQLPGIAYFDSMADLKQKINTLDLAEQSRVMREHNRERLHDATVKWAEALSRKKSMAAALGKFQRISMMP